MPTLTRREFFRRQNGAQGTINAWVAFGARSMMPVAKVGHVPDLQTKRVSRGSSGQESSRTGIGTVEVGGEGM